MKAIDTSALLAIALDEPRGPSCVAAFEIDDEWIISAGTVAEALIVGRRRGVGEAIDRLILANAIEIIPVTAAFARLAADAYDRWGKGVHPAALNLGDCFAYALAKERGCPLLLSATISARPTSLACCPAEAYRAPARSAWSQASFARAGKASARSFASALAAVPRR